MINNLSEQADQPAEEKRFAHIQKKIMSGRFFFYILFILFFLFQFLYFIHR